MAKMKHNVLHDGHALPKGSECPKEFEKVMAEKGLLEDAQPVEVEAPKPSKKGK